MRPSLHRPTRRLRRRQLLAGAAASVAGIAVAVAELRGAFRGGRRSNPPVLPAHGGTVTVDFGSLPDRAGWGDAWFTPAFLRKWEVRSGRARLHLPTGLPATAPDQPFPVFFQDHDCVSPDQEISFRLANGGLWPGLLFGASSIWDYLAVTVENDRLIAARYGRKDRQVLAARPVRPLGRRGDHRLRVSAHDGHLRAKLWRDGDAEPGWQLAVSHPVHQGSVGVLVVAPENGQPAGIALHSYRVAARSFAITPAGLPVLISGPPHVGAGAEVTIRACADRPCDLRFEWSDRADFGSSLGSTDYRPASEPPWSDSHTIAVNDQQPVYWRAVARRGTVETASPAQMVILPPSDQPLVLAAASCAQLWQAAPYFGLGRLTDAVAPRRVAMLAYEGDLGYPGNIRDSCYLSAADTFADRFKRTLADPHFQTLRATTPTVFIMDDHDYGPPNNADRTDVAPWAAPLWNRFHAEPSTVGYMDGRFGDTHWLTLDGRRYCDPVTAPNTPAKTKLGRQQRAWLEQTLAGSDAKLFVIFSADIFASRVAIDCWPQGWPDEYSALMTLFFDHQLGGKRVIILSGDAHGMRVHYHPDPQQRPGTAAAPVVEFVCSGLRARTWSMNLPGDPTVDPLRRVKYKSGLGMISIDPASASKRQITLRAIAGDVGPIDLFPPLIVPFSPA